MTNKIKELTDKTFDAMVMRKDDTPVLVDFWATWCGPCRAMEPTLESLAEELDGKAIIGKVNVDEQANLARTAGIQSIPTMILLQRGEIKEVFVGITSKKTLQEKISNLMQQNPLPDAAVVQA